MFRLLGAAIRLTWPAWLIGWAVLFAFLQTTAPTWHQVAQDREFGFLPADSPTRQGQTLFQQAFPEDRRISNVVIVMNRADEELRTEDRSFVKDVVKPALLNLAQEEGGLADNEAMPADAGKTSTIAAVRTLDDPGTGVLLVSADRQATLVVIDLTTELLERRNRPLLEKIETLTDGWRAQGQVPSGLNLHLTGSATVGRDMTLGQRQSAAAIQFWTVVIVILILMLVYRAPLLAMIPLISVFMATQIAMKLLARLAEAGLITLFEGIEIFITVILYLHFRGSS